MFKLENVVYKDILSITNVFFDKGDIVAITGKSGSGKTTFLRLLNKMNSVDDGVIYYFDQNIKNLNSLKLRREVQMLSQFPVVNDDTVRENLNLALKFQNKPYESDENLKKILDLVQLDKGLEENCDNFSGGEKQRLCIARILVSDPDVFLFDEPSSSLDKDTEKIVMKKIIDHIRNKNKTLIYITHSLDIAHQFSDRVFEIIDKDLKEVEYEK